jgi:hypothetical protein
MKRHELEHLIRAAGAITGADEIIVIGSQAILAARPDSPDSLLRSCEADMFTLRDPKDADLIDGSIGEGSPFHETFGYYAQGVWLDTATLPAGWQGRLVVICNENTRSVTARCLEPHDLAVSKLVAGREKDFAFLLEMSRHHMIDEKTLLERVALLEVPDADRTAAAERWHRISLARERESP